MTCPIKETVVVVVVLFHCNLKYGYFYGEYSIEIVMANNYELNMKLKYGIEIEIARYDI